MLEAVIAMIIAFAVQYELPPNFVLAVASTKTPIEKIEDIRREWRNENSARYHVKNLQDIAWESYRNTWWQVALFYNMGNGLRNARASNANIEYANGVIERYFELEGGVRLNLVVGYTNERGFY